MPVFLTPMEIEKRCGNRQCVLIGDYTKSMAVSKFRCLLCGEEFQTTINKLTNERKDGQPGCTKCYTAFGRRSKLDVYLVAVQNYAESRGGTITTRQINSAKERVTFKCSNEHEWDSVAEAIINQRTWCPHCAGQTLRTLNELDQIAESRGGRLLSTAYVNVDAKYDFQCVLGHRFSNSFKKVEGGQWCPTCNKGKISEEVSRTVFEQLFGMPFQKERPQWLRNSRGRLMELDGANLELNIAFEYQGAQHFKKNLYMTDDTKLVQRIADDERKKQLCKRHGITLVVLTYEMHYANFPLEIKRQLIDAGYPLEALNFDKPIDLARAYIRNDRLEELRDLLGPKQIEVLSNKWLGSNASYDLKCLSCGHLWSASGNMFFNSRRVAGCDKCNRKKAGETQKLNMDALTEFAASFGGEVVSTAYVQRRYTYSWRCVAGHEFKGNFNNMAFRNQFCNVCEGRKLRPGKSKTTSIDNV